VGSYPGKADVLPYLLILLEEGPVDDVLNISGVLGVHPDVDLLVGENDRHSAVDCFQLRGGRFGENDDFILGRVEPCDQEVVSFLGSQAEGLFLLVPLKVALHDDDAPILDDVDKHPFLHKFLDSTIDHHVVLALMAPGTIVQFSVFFPLHVLVLEVLLPLLVDVEAIGLDDRYVGRGADIVGESVTLATRALLGPGDLEETGKGEGLEYPSAHP
jgi:hypothetical protein